MTRLVAPVREVGDLTGFSARALVAVPGAMRFFAEVLRQGGYSTAFIGKNHNIADWETSISGPFDRWPGLQGFDYFYGFIGGEMDQWQPILYRGTTPVAMDIPKGRESNYTLNDALADETIEAKRDIGGRIEQQVSRRAKRCRHRCEPEKSRDHAHIVG